MQCHLFARHYICELCNVILLQGIMYVNYAMPCCLGKRHICELYHAVLFCISHCFCRQCFYIQLLFLCISHLKWWGEMWSENKVFRADNATCWSRYLAGYRELLIGGFIDWWPVLFPPCGLCSNFAGLYYPCHACCLALLSFYIIYGLPSAYLLTI